MTNLKKCLFCFCILNLSIISVKSQTVTHSVFLWGNTPPQSTAYLTLIESLKTNMSATHPNTLLVLGDITEQDKQGNINIEKLQVYQELSNLKQTETYITGGDRDWNNSGKNGLQNIKFIEKYLEKELKLKKAFVPSDGCPGPKVIDINDSLIVIAINSQWFIHPFDKPTSPDTDCSTLSPADFYEELEEILDNNDDKNIIIMAHHPIYSSGQYGGQHLELRHLIPVYGSFDVAFHQNIGTPKDFAYPSYKQYIDNMRKLLASHRSVIYASSHEHHTAISKHGDNIFINTSASDKIMKAEKDAANLYLKNAAAYTRLDYYDDGRVESINYYLNKDKIQADTVVIMTSGCEYPLNPQTSNKAFNPCLVDIKLSDEVSLEQKAVAYLPTSSDTTVAAGAEYAAGKFKRFWMGYQYRDEWTCPVTVPFLNLDSIGGGLIPYAKGGGLQTVSLKFKDKNGEKYAFRQLDKSPEKSLTEGVKKTIYKDIVKDLIASQHPYGTLVASKLMDAAGILHAQPTLWVMPNDPALGIYREEFEGKIGTLEPKPRGKSKNYAGFAGADKIVKSNQMLKSLYKDSKHRVDKKAYAIARIFDIWIGDWDRHEDNWIWAKYDKKGGVIYRPIPKDRDHVFSSWTGVIPSVADKVVMNAAHFDYKFNNIVHLTFKARHLDRQLGSELDKNDWLEACQYIQSVMTDKVIDEALATLPKAIYDLKGDIIRAKLQSRRADLVNGTMKFYALLAKEVDVVGSNEKEQFDVIRNEDGSVLVKMFRIQKEENILVFQRLFKPQNTEGVNLYGLSGKDIFSITGKGNHQNIKVRIIGGDKKDEVKDAFYSKSKTPFTEVFDSKSEDDIVKSPYIKVHKSAHEAEYNNKSFEYDALFPLPVLRQSSGNRLGVGVDITYVKKGFNKPDFAQKYNIYVLYYPQLKANRIELTYWKRYIVGLSDLKIQQMFSTFYDKFPFYYGIGTRSVRDDNLLEQGYYRTDFLTARTKIGLEKTFIQKSKLNYSLLYEYNHVKPANTTQSIFLKNTENPIKGLGQSHLVGAEINFDLDFRDNAHFTKNGSLLSIHSATYQGIYSNNKTDKQTFFNNSEIVWAQYQTFNIGTELTLTGRTGLLGTFGSAPFFHQTALGSNSYLRGYTRNRFLDKYAAFYNLEARLHIGTFNTILAPIRFGIFGFFDNGIVWGEKSYKSNKWNNAKGLGMYIAPIADVYSLNFYFAKSNDKGIYSDYKIGWRF